MNKLTRLAYIEERLKAIVEDAKNASDAKKNYLRQGYRAFQNEKKAIIKKIEKEEGQLPLDNTRE